MARISVIIRKISSASRSLYLTFDDGPDETQTPQVLDVLQKYKVPATFFQVAIKAQQHPDLVRLICERGHQIGNHSFDHRYSVFFKGEKAITDWIQSAEQIFADLGVTETCGFRSPVGIRTPELHRALKKLNCPLILWNVRFFDSTWKWTIEKAQSSLRNLETGSIILLHDVQKPKNMASFLETLEYFIQEAQAQGFRFELLPKLRPRT